MFEMGHTVKLVAIGVATFAVCMLVYNNVDAVRGVLGKIGT